MLRSVVAFAVAAIPAGLLAQDRREDTETRAPSVQEALAAGVDVLLKLQENYEPDRRVGRLRDAELPRWQERERARLRALREKQGSGYEWPYEGVYRVGGIVPPGYRVGGTAIVCTALVHAPGFADNKPAQSAVQRALRFMLDELEANELLGAGPKRGYDVRGWAHTYALDFLLLAERRKIIPHYETHRVREMIPHLLDCLEANQTRHGGWNYAGNSISPFMTGSTLLALYHARAQGYAIGERMVTRALDGLQKSRTNVGSYVYSGVVPSGTSAGRRSSRRTAMPGASARASIAELALHLAGRSDATKLRIAVDAFFEHWDELFKRKSKQGTHEGPYGIAPYYFMYGHVYAALAIEQLPEAARPSLRIKMQKTLWRTREADGGWNDRIFPRSKSYSTAMAMLALMAPSTKLARWQPRRDTRR